MIPSIARTGAAALAVATVAALAPGADAAQGKTLRFWSHQTSFVTRGADGAVVAQGTQPAVGMSFMSTDDDHVGDHATHHKKIGATDHISCTFTHVNLATGMLVALCDGQIALPGGMLLMDHVTVDLSAKTLVFKLTGGTGKYDHLKSGTAKSTAYSSKTADTNLVISL